MPGHWERAELPLDLARRLGELGLVGDGIEGYGCPPMSTVAAGLTGGRWVNGWAGLVGAGASAGAGLGSAASRVIGAVSGPDGGDSVLVELEEVVRGGCQAPFAAFAAASAR